MTFKVGDRVRIKAAGYRLPKGTEVVVQATYDSGVAGRPYYLARSTADGKSWYVDDRELEPLKEAPSNDAVASPYHYQQHPSGIEIIDITRHHSFTIGNALKYLFRHEYKGNPVQDLKKAIAYIEFAIEDLEREK